MNAVRFQRVMWRWFGPFALLVLAGPSAAGGLELVRNHEPQQVFVGRRAIAAVFRNIGDAPVRAEVRMRLFQAGSATAAEIGETPWKQLRVEPDQTVLESASLDFPAVKAGTLFVVQWLTGTNTVVGTTEVMVYPTNLLGELKALLGDAEGSLGVVDRLKQLKPLLGAVKVGFVDLGENGLGHFSGRLAIVGPFASRAEVHEGMPEQVAKLAARGVAVVWIQPPEKPDQLEPSFYAVPGNGAAVLVARPELVANLPESPQAQLNLIRLCQLALDPEPGKLPSK